MAFPADDAPLTSCEIEKMSLFVTGPRSYSEPQLHTSLFGDACPVEPGFIDDVAYCATIKATDEIERHRKLAGNNRRGD